MFRLWGLGRPDMQPAGKGASGVVEFAAAFCLIAALVLAGVLLRAGSRLRHAEASRRATEHEHAALLAVAGTAPLAAFRWHAGDGGQRIVGGDSGFSCWRDFLAGLSPPEAARIEAERQALLAGGKAFSAAAIRGHGAWRIEGRRAGGDTIVWLLDASAAAQVAAARDEAAANADRLREMLDMVPVPVWRRGADLTLQDCNQAYAAALDTTRERALADSRELAADGTRGKLPKLAGEAAAAGARSERRHVVIGGARRLVEVTEAPAATGGTVGFAIDRTDVETAEAELWRHVNAHAETLETIHAAVAIYGADRRLKFFNSSYAALWGLEEQWLATEPSMDEVLERLHERRRIPEAADFPAFKRERLQLFTSLIEPQQELMHLPDDRTLRVSLSPHPFGGIILLYEDVTDRLALERSYNTLTEVQRETLDHLYEGIAVYGSDGRLKLHNPAYRRIWGLLEGDLAGEPHISEIVEKTRRFFDDGEDWGATKAGIIAKVTAHALASEPLDRLDGSVLQMAAVPLPDGNVLLTCLDVTDTTRVERALRDSNEALETAGRLKSEFIANVSYELRTPLNAVIGFAEMLSRQYFGTLSPRQLDYSHSILESAHQLMALINDILDLATIEAGYLMLETGTVDIGDMLRSVLTLTHERARNRDLTLDCRYPPDIGTIVADERRLKQALFNLISNAIKFTPPGGSIRLGADRQDGALVLNVTDTGVGIPAADRERVFEKFERGNPQTRHSGAGLGLALVKNLIELHGGTVELTSTPGKGTSVSCRLPAAAPVATAKSA